MESDWWTGYLPDHLQVKDAPGPYEPESKPSRWDRLTLTSRSHPLHPMPNVTRDDLLLPAASDRLLLLGACLLCGICISVLWLYVPAYLVTLAAGLGWGNWIWLSMTAVALISGLLIFAIASKKEHGYSDTL